jgi:hypothetical protein
MIQFAGWPSGSYTDPRSPLCALWLSLSARPCRACSTDHALQQTLGVLGSCIVGRAGRRRSSCRRSLSTSLLANSQGAHTTARGQRRVRWRDRAKQLGRMRWALTGALLQRPLYKVRSFPCSQPDRPITRHMLVLSQCARMGAAWGPSSLGAAERSGQLLLELLVCGGLCCQARCSGAVVRRCKVRLETSDS